MHALLSRGFLAKHASAVSEELCIFSRDGLRQLEVNADSSKTVGSKKAVER
jgi:hypothetical protein